MKWSNVKLVLGREVRDQLRDRRTLFMILVLPVLLYPLMGMIAIQATSFVREHPVRVLIMNADSLPADPPLLDPKSKELQFAQELRSLVSDGSEITLERLDSLPKDGKGQQVDPKAAAENKIAADEYDLVVFVPPDFATRLARFRDNPDNKTNPVPEPKVYYSTAKETSLAAFARLETVLVAWRKQIIERTLETRISSDAIQPFVLSRQDVAEPEVRQALVWSKILPFIVLVWALTGAFYPAIDLCAGEKERGTLETLLTSPAARSEIVWGKLLTVMIFSMATSVLNLISMGFTGLIFVSRMQAMSGAPESMQFGPPPLAAGFWLLLALIPIAALFSALSLSVAVLARSTKEGQYYLMPLLLGSLPFMVVPILPGVELNLGMSLIPVTGVMLMLRLLIEGQYAAVLPYVIPVVVVTGGCVLLAIRWAVDQFNNESVLFRESERFSLGAWVKSIVRQRGDTPTAAQGVLCAIVILIAVFFARLAAPPQGWVEFVRSALILQIGVIAAPALLMAVLLTRRPTKTLLLRPTRWAALPAAVLLALAVHPLAMLLGHVIQELYPLDPAKMAEIKPLEEMILGIPWVWALLAIAVAPAICEELAFRGFVLSGLRRTGHRWGAIVISSLFFGITHGILQQSMMAFFVGMLIGYIAVQCGSILPCMLFHLTHNGLMVGAARLTHALKSDPAILERYAVLRWLFVAEGNEVTYHWSVYVLAAAVALGLVAYFRRLPLVRTDEERLQEALDHQHARASA